MTLSQLYGTGRFDTDKGSIHSYIDFYETALAPYRKPGVQLLEIGLQNQGVTTGGSIPLWVAFFGEGAVTGLDIAPCPPVRGANIVRGDATKVVVRNAAFAEKTFDIIIDDASHLAADQLATFLLYRSLLRPGGLYVIEDMQNWDAIALLLEIEPTFSVIDRRRVKNRYDDVLMVWRCLGKQSEPVAVSEFLKAQSILVFG